MSSALRVSLRQQAQAALEEERQKLEKKLEDLRPREIARFRGLMWEVLAVNLIREDLDEPRWEEDGLTFVLLASDATLSQADLGLLTACDMCETEIVYPVRSMLELGHLLERMPLCESCAQQIQIAQQETHQVFQATPAELDVGQRYLEALREVVTVHVRDGMPFPWEKEGSS